MSFAYNFEGGVPRRVFKDTKGDRNKDLTALNKCPEPGYRGLVIEDTCVGVNGRLPPPPSPPLPPLSPPGGGWESRQGNCLPAASDNANLVYTNLEEAARECYSRPDSHEGEGCEGSGLKLHLYLFEDDRVTAVKNTDTASCNTGQGGITYFKPLHPPSASGGTDPATPTTLSSPPPMPPPPCNAFIEDNLAIKRGSNLLSDGCENGSAYVRTVRALVF